MCFLKWFLETSKISTLLCCRIAQLLYMGEATVLSIGIFSCGTAVFDVLHISRPSSIAKPCRVSLAASPKSCQKC